MSGVVPVVARTDGSLIAIIADEVFYGVVDEMKTSLYLDLLILFLGSSSCINTYLWETKVWNFRGCDKSRCI